jgi:hypothetical protein
MLRVCTVSYVTAIAWLLFFSLPLSLCVFQPCVHKVWISDIPSPLGVAASSTLLAVSQATPTIARVLVYDLGGTLVATFGGRALEEGNTCCAGVNLGRPSTCCIYYRFNVPSKLCRAVRVVYCDSFLQMAGSLWLARPGRHG